MALTLDVGIIGIPRTTTLLRTSFAPASQLIPFDGTANEK